MISRGGEVSGGRPSHGDAHSEVIRDGFWSERSGEAASSPVSVSSLV